MEALRIVCYELRFKSRTGVRGGSCELKKLVGISFAFPIILFLEREPWKTSLFGH